MILAFQLALCGLCGQATDEQCLLARPTTDTLEEELEEEEDLDYQGGASSDYRKRWEGEWEKQEPLHRLSHFVALAVRAARDPRPLQSETYPHSSLSLLVLALR